MGMRSAAGKTALLPHLFSGGKRPDGAAPPSPTHRLHKATAQARGSPRAMCVGGRVEQSWYLRKRPRCQSPGTPAASHCRRQLLHPGPPNCALPVARSALLRCAARLPGDRHCQVQPRPRRRPSRRFIGCGDGWLRPSGAGPLQGRSGGWGPKLGEASCGHQELLLCQPRNRQLQRKAREEASSPERGPWLRGTDSLGWNIEIIARGLGAGWFCWLAF